MNKGEVTDGNDDDSSDISGYHSDSDSAIFLNSPLNTSFKSAKKYNTLLYRSGKPLSIEKVVHIPKDQCTFKIHHIIIMCINHIFDRRFSLKILRLKNKTLH